MLFSGFKLLALAAVAFALPSTEEIAATDATKTGATPAIPEIANAAAVVLCTGSFPGGGCNEFTLSDGRCVNFTGGKGAYHKALTGVQVPLGYVCTLHRNFSCNDGPADFVILSGGTYNLAATPVPNGYGNRIYFNDQASAMVCDPLV